MDDLTRIKGVGKAAAERLVAAGIDTFEKLAHDGRAGEHGVKAEWIAAAAELLHSDAGSITNTSQDAPQQGEVVQDEGDLAGGAFEETGQMIRVSAPGGRRRRAGISFTSTAIDIDIGQLGATAEEREATLKLLLDDPELSVAPVRD